MDYTQLVFSVDSGIATIQLNRSCAMNALSSDMLLELAHVFTSIESRDDVAVVILTGAGDRAFCAGLDLKELSEGTEKFFSRVSQSNLIDAIQSCSSPIIGAINGCAITGGFELALACDFLIASDNAKFADTHARVGLVPAWGMSQKLPRLIGINRAKELSLTGRFISSEEALNWGLVNHVVPADELLPKARALAESMMSNNPDAMTKIRSVMDKGWRSNLAEGLVHETQVFKDYMASMAQDTVANSHSEVMAQGRNAQR